MYLTIAAVNNKCNMIDHNRFILFIIVHWLCCVVLCACTFIQASPFSSTDVLTHRNVLLALILLNDIMDDFNVTAIFLSSQSY